MNNNNNIGTKVRYFRKRAGMSQAQLELEMNASPGSISRIENGAVNPTKETIYELSEVLQLSRSELDYIIGKTANPATQDEIAKAVESTSEYFSRKGTLAYILDERFRLIAISSTFTKLLQLDQKTVSNNLLRNIIDIVLDKDLVSAFLDEKGYEEILKNLISVFKGEIGFMIDDPLIKPTLLNIKNDKLASKIYEEVKAVQIIFNSLDKRGVYFKYGKFRFKMYFDYQPLFINPRFFIVEYRPDNIVLRILSRI